MDFEIIQSILIIVGIDLVLGGDNAIVIALASRNLPTSQRNKAILLGTGLAVGLRVIMTGIAVFLLQIPFLQFVGGVLLVYIAMTLVTDQEDGPEIQAHTSLMAAVKTIVFADLVMGFDNVLAIAGAARGEVYLVVFGLLISVPIIIWGSKLILALMEKFPFLIYIGAAVLAYTAAEMILGEATLQYFYSGLPILHWIIPPLTIGIVMATGVWYNLLKERSS
ncbi:TerC family protein [Pontibacillus salipaludis]|uniref:Membrane protein n=1 Tax=Pontibacillus salipaludis TaxID=1697394 RepID=A0ABQ1Q828_9BACI|nr:TerC family protein [Pontibacillus salipaludis]GGD18195.1 membrane protein [Pontibacillus salipaludis]